MIPGIVYPPRPRSYRRNAMPTSKTQNTAAAVADEPKTSEKRRSLEVAVRDGRLTTEGRVEVIVDFLGDAFELVGDLHEKMVSGTVKMEKDHAAILLRTREIERVITLNDTANREAHMRMSDALLSLSDTIRRNESASRRRHEQLMAEVLTLKGMRVLEVTPESHAEQRLREIKLMAMAGGVVATLWALHIWALVHK